MKLAEMFDSSDARTFEERRAEVVEIVRAASDFSGVDQGLRTIFQVMCEADNESEFDEAFIQLASSICDTTTLYLQSV